MPIPFIVVAVAGLVAAACGAMGFGFGVAVGAARSRGGSHADPELLALLRKGVDIFAGHLATERASENLRTSMRDLFEKAQAERAWFHQESSALREKVAVLEKQVRAAGIFQ